ncbi:MAG: purine/pyrimidine permease [Veillonellales bacterium]
MSILYQLNDRLPASRTLLYSFQWLAFNLVNVSVIPVVVGQALGLDPAGSAQLSQRIMFFASAASILQVLYGHRLPIIEGPAGMWWGIFLTLGYMAPAMGKDIALLRSDLELGMIIAGMVLVLMGMTGLISRALKLFTPPVTGTVLVLLGLQLSGPFLRGMLGITREGDAVSFPAMFVSLLVIAVVILVNLKCHGFFRSIAILIGTAIGWIAAALLGISPSIGWNSRNIAEIPALFAWGTPTFDPAIILICILTGILVLSNSVASILAMERTLDITAEKKDYDRGVTCTGIGDILSGIGATVGLVPYSGSAGLVSLTGVGARLPFLLFSILMMLMGLLPSIGQFLSSIPAPVGYSVLLASFCQMLCFGLQDYARIQLTGRRVFVVGIPLLVGTGILTLPASTFISLPVWLRYIFSNGFLAGMLLCILLEHVLLPEK